MYLIVGDVLGSFGFYRSTYIVIFFGIVNRLLFFLRYKSVFLVFLVNIIFSKLVLFLIYLKFWIKREADRLGEVFFVVCERESKKLVAFVNREKVWMGVIVKENNGAG